MGKPLQVLIIENSENDALRMIQTLANCGYDPGYKRVKTSRALRKALGDQAWDIILCGGDVPNLSGPKAIGLVKKLQIDTPFIMVSGAIGEENAALCIRAGARDFISKQNLPGLAGAVKRELSERKSRIKRSKNEQAVRNKDAGLSGAVEKGKSAGAGIAGANEDLQPNIPDQNIGLTALISERTQLARALKESETKFRNFLEEAPMGICLADLSGKVQYVNRKIEEATGWTREELVSRDALALGFFDEATKRILLARLAARLSGDAPRTTEIPVARKDGSCLWVNLKTTILYQDGLPTGLLLAFIDVTDRKEMEQKILESEVKYRLLVENSSEVILIAQKGFLKFVNRASVDMFGASYEKLMLTPFTEFIHPDDRGLVMSNHLRRLRGEAVPSHYTFRVVTPAGEVRWAEIRAKVVSWEGEPATLNFITDITSRRQAEEKLKESEEKFRFLTEKMTDIVWIAGLDLQTTYVTPSVEKVLGFTRKERMLQKVSEQLTPESLSRAFDTLTQELTCEEKGDSDPERTLKQELEFYHKDGSTRWLDVTISGIRDEQGILTGIHGVARDISERKKAEAKLKESEERFSALFDHSRDCVYVIDLAGNFVEANAAALQLLGYERADVPSLNIVSLLDENDMAKGVQEFEEIIRSGFQNARSEHTLKRKNGGLIQVETQASLVYSHGKPHSILGIARDITERKQAEEALRESEKKYRELVDFLPISLFEMDLQGNVTSANPAIFELFGYESADLENGLKADQMIVPDDLPRFGGNLQRLIGGDKKGTSEYRGVRKDGSTFPFLVFPSVIIRDGKPVGIRGAIIDLTERKRVQEELQKSEEKYRGILNNIEEGYYETGLAGDFTFFNDSLCRIWGYSRDEILDMGYRKYLDKASEKSIAGIFHGVLATGTPARFHYQLQRKDGARKWLEASISLIRDPSGLPAGFRGLVHDVTERKKMVDAIRQSEERYRTIIEQMADGYFEVDLKGRFTFVNEAQSANLGYTREEMIGMQTRQYVAGEKVRELYRLFGKILATGIPVKAYDLEYIKKDGTISYNSISASLIRNTEGDPIGFRGISRDVTERKTAEMQLRKYADEISDLYNNAPCGYHSISSDGTFLRMNDTELKWLGYERDELIGKKKWPDLLTPESVASFEKIFPVFKERGWANDLEFDVVRKDGSIFSVLLNATAIKDPDGHFIQSRSTLFDVTQLNKVRLELNEKNLELTRTYEDLRTKQAMILQQEKMASIGMLAAGVAHEIKNPLAIILQGMDFLQTAAQDDSQTTEAIERLKEAVRRADVIVKGLLSYARQTPVALVEQDIRVLLDESLALTEHEFHAKNILLIKDYAPDLPMIALDSNQMKQVFINLILNGIEAMPRRGKFTISVRSMIIDDAGNRALQLSFKDTGTGIPADISKHIFDPFFTTKAIGNTGLGLSISKGIIDMHGGIIYAENQEREGAAIIIRLPVTS
ncbi:MAG: PAS domain S-box protein [Deltaproteobacteria bacterium]